MNLYIWNLVTQPNNKHLTIVASTIEEAIAAAKDSQAQCKVVGATRGDSVDALSPAAAKGHPYR